MEELATIQSKIYEIRGQRVMLDRDFGRALRRYDQCNLNKAVKRNIERFPERVHVSHSDIEQEFLIIHKM